MKKKRLVMAVVFVLVLSLGSFIGTRAFADTENATISKGVMIDEVDVSDMSAEQAREAVNKFVAELAAKKVTVNLDEEKAEITLAELGFTSESVDMAVEKAIELGKDGNLIKRYKELKTLENEGEVFALEYMVDNAKIAQFVEEECASYTVKAKNAKIERENGEFIITEHVNGRKVVEEDTIEKIKTAILSDWNREDIELDAVITEKEPKYTTEMVSKCKDVLGTFKTSYGSSSYSRANNLANGARLINGTVVWPGETFSTGETMSPITVANGYSVAGAYENGKVVDSVGGGVCQVSTTLYNAVLRAELEIVERSNHSMIVNYVEPSMDAAIAGSYKDFKFKNNTDAPIYIVGETEGRVITFTIYGHETRDTENRTIEFVSKVLSTIPAGEKIIKDKTKPESYRKVEQSAHTGYKAELWKVIYVNGEEESRELVNSSVYNPSPAYVVVGTKKEDEKDKDKNKDKNNNKNNNSNKNNKDDDAEEPTEATEAPTEATEAPTEATAAPTEATEAPTEATAAPTEAPAA